MVICFNSNFQPNSDTKMSDQTSAGQTSTVKIFNLAYAFFEDLSLFSDSLVFETKIKDRHHYYVRACAKKGLDRSTQFEFEIEPGENFGQRKTVYVIETPTSAYYVDFDKSSVFRRFLSDVLGITGDISCLELQVPAPTVQNPTGLGEELNGILKFIWSDDAFREAVIEDNKTYFVGTYSSANLIRLALKEAEVNVKSFLVHIPPNITESCIFLTVESREGEIESFEISYGENITLPITEFLEAKREASASKCGQIVSRLPIILGFQIGVETVDSSVYSFVNTKTPAVTNRYLKAYGPQGRVSEEGFFSIARACYLEPLASLIDLSEDCCNTNKLIVDIYEKDTEEFEEDVLTFSSKPVAGGRVCMFPDHYVLEDKYYVVDTFLGDGRRLALSVVITPAQLNAVLKLLDTLRCN